ncbi:hypothetical protein BDZ97DRAFT_1347712 [Flammula alnicola]|nr:hypothetical protein BDZ97DRAFT_1347712 [Flammula alnicola]
MASTLTPPRTPSSPPSGLLAFSPELILEIASRIAPWNELRSTNRDPDSLNQTMMNRVRNPAYSDTAEAQLSLGNMRLVCHYFSQVLGNVLFKALVFDFPHFSISDVESRLSSLSNGTSPACRHAIFLRIKCLDPLQTGYKRDGTYFSKGSIPNDEYDKLQARATQVTDTHLEKAILSLQNLRCVAWNVEDNNAPNILIMGALSSLPSLEDLTLRFDYHCHSPNRLRLDRFSGLRSLAVSFPSFGRSRGFDASMHNEVVNQVSKIIRQSPLLSHLSIVQYSKAN